MCFTGKEHKTETLINDIDYENIIRNLLRNRLYPPHDLMFYSQHLTHMVARRHSRGLPDRRLCIPVQRRQGITTQQILLKL